MIDLLCSMVCKTLHHWNKSSICSNKKPHRMKCVCVCVHAGSSNEIYTHFKRPKKNIRWSKRTSKLDKRSIRKNSSAKFLPPFELFYGTQLDFHFTNVLCVFISFFLLMSVCVCVDLFFIALFFVVPFSMHRSATIYIENV